MTTMNLMAPLKRSLTRDEATVTSYALMQYIENAIGNHGAKPDSPDMAAAGRVLLMLTDALDDSRPGWSQFYTSE